MSIRSEVNAKLPARFLLFTKIVFVETRLLILNADPVFEDRTLALLDMMDDVDPIGSECKTSGKIPAFHENCFCGNPASHPKRGPSLRGSNARDSGHDGRCRSARSE